MHVHKHSVAIATDGSGNFTGYTDNVSGELLDVIYVKDPTTPMTGTPSVTITSEILAQALLTVASLTAGTSPQQLSPRKPTHKNDGTAALYAATGTPVNERWALDGERVKVVIASGGANKLGTLWFIMGGG